MATPVPTGTCAPTMPAPPQKLVSYLYLPQTGSSHEGRCESAPTNKSPRHATSVADVQVHGTALALAATVAEAEHLRHELLHRAASGEVDTVAAVGGDDAVLSGKPSLDTSSNRFLAVVQVAETTDGARLERSHSETSAQTMDGHTSPAYLVLNIRRDLDAADQKHLAIVVQELVLGGGRRGSRCLNFCACVSRHQRRK